MKLTTGSCGVGFHGRSFTVEGIICCALELLAGNGELGRRFVPALHGVSEDGLALGEAGC